ncbi:MAG TPA: helix-turn-helix domain-containing protein [Casimicrobiaceae bacterium]
MTDYARLVRDLQVPPIPKLILYALATRADAEGICWPSIRTLCHDTGLARRTVQMHLQKLISDQLVIREARIGGPSVLRLNIRLTRCATRTSAGDAPVDNEPAESAGPAHPPRVARTQGAHEARAQRTVCTGDAHDVTMTSAGRAPEVTKKFPLNSPLKLPGKLTPPGGRSTNPDRSPDAQLRWWTTEAGIRCKGAELGVAPRVGESYRDYKNRLFKVQHERRREFDEMSEAIKAATG